MPNVLLLLTGNSNTSRATRQHRYNFYCAGAIKMSRNNGIVDTIRPVHRATTHIQRDFGNINKGGQKEAVIAIEIGSVQIINGKQVDDIKKL